MHLCLRREVYAPCRAECGRFPVCSVRKHWIERMGRLFGAPLLGSLVTYTHAACPCFFFGGFRKRHGIVLSPDVIRVPAGMIISISLVRRVTSCGRRPWAVTDKLISSVDVKLRVPSQRGLEVAHRFAKKRKSELFSKTYTSFTLNSISYHFQS